MVFSLCESFILIRCIFLSLNTGTDLSKLRRVGRVVNPSGPDYVPFFLLTWNGRTTRKVYYDASPMTLETLIEDDLLPAGRDIGSLQVSVSRRSSTICTYDAYVQNDCFR